MPAQCGNEKWKGEVRSLKAWCGVCAESYRLTVFASSRYLCGFKDRKLRLLHTNINIDDIEEGMWIYHYEGHYFVVWKEYRCLNTLSPA
jgi:hypothetical protein